MGKPHAAPETKPTPDESRRDRVAMNVFQVLIGTDQMRGLGDRFGAYRSWDEFCAIRAFDCADAFLAERARRAAGDKGEI